MLTSDLQGRRVRREGGEILGRLYEIHAKDGRIETLVCGGRGWLQRLTGSRAGHRVRWDQVVRITPREIVIKESAPAPRSAARARGPAMLTRG